MITKDEMIAIENFKEQRFAEGRTVLLTRSYHQFKSLTDAFGIQCKWTSEDVQFTTVFSFKSHAKCIQTSSEFKTMNVIACCYNSHECIGLVEEIDN